jgi:competence protein ComGC
MTNRAPVETKVVAATGSAARPDDGYGALEMLVTVLVVVILVLLILRLA